MANDSDLIVNVDLLVESETRLKGIQRELKSLDNRKDDMRPYWGSGEVADAMGEFVDNWDDYRTKSWRASRRLASWSSQRSMVSPERTPSLPMSCGRRGRRKK